MDYLTGMHSSPVYEFPYSGYATPSIPLLNYNANVSPLRPTSSLDTLLHHSPSIFTVPSAPHIDSLLGSNVTVYPIPDNVPLDLLLRELGVDVNSLQQIGSINNYRTNTSLPVELIFQPSTRRRRLVCREVSDSETDDYHRHSSHHRHRDHYNSGSNRHRQSPDGLHSILSDVWKNAERASRNVSPSRPNSNINSQWQAMRNSPSQSYPPVNNNTWQGMRPPAPPIPPQQQRNAVNNVWNRIDNQQNSPVAHVWNRAENAIQQGPPPSPNLPWRQMSSSPPPMNSAAANVWNRAENAMHQGSPPPPNLPWNQMSSSPPPMNSAVANAWNRAENAINQGTPPSPNLAWNQMSSSPPPMNSAVANAWNRAENPIHQGSPPPPNLPWNQMSSSPPPMNSAWNQMAGGPTPPQPQQAPPSQQPFFFPGSPTNASWNQPQQGQFPSQNSPYSQPPMGAPQKGPNTNAPTSFASLLSQARTQGVPFSGAM